MDSTTSSTDPATVVRMLLANTSNPAIVRSLVAPDATYVSLNYSNPDLKKIMPYAGTHDKVGPGAIITTFRIVNEIWSNEAFEIQSLFAEKGNVAVFGRFTYKSRNLEKEATSPFSVWARVNDDGKITYMQFMEVRSLAEAVFFSSCSCILQDTLATASTFKVGGKTTYRTKNEWGNVEI